MKIPVGMLDATLSVLPTHPKSAMRAAIAATRVSVHGRLRAAREGGEAALNIGCCDASDGCPARKPQMLRGVLKRFFDLADLRWFRAS